MTLVKQPIFRVVLVALQADAEVGAHETEGPVTVQAIEGRLAIHVGADEVVLDPGQLLVLRPGLRHSMHARDDAAFLLTLTAETTHPAEHSPRAGPGIPDPESGELGKRRLETAAAASVRALGRVQGVSFDQHLRVPSGEGMVHAGVHMRRIGYAIAICGLLAACRPRAPLAPPVAVDGAKQAITAAVVSLERGETVVIDGQSLASTVVLPDFYRRRGFGLALDRRRRDRRSGARRTRERRRWARPR